MAGFTEKLQIYADLLVRYGLNLQPGQRLVIGTPAYPVDLQNTAVAHAVTRSAYQAGASLVTVLYVDPEINRIRLQMASEESLTLQDDWLFDGLSEIARQGDAVLMLISTEPHFLDGIDTERAAQYQNAKSPRTMALRRLLIAHSNYTITNVPTQEWAEHIGLTLEAFWEDMFDICRVTAPDPSAAWDAHLKALHERAGYLQARLYQALHFSAPGTNLTVGLAHGHRWLSALTQSDRNITYMANFPTEEVFTTPHAEKVEGYVTVTRPLHYRGSIVEDISLTFKGGRVVSASAGKGEHYLQSLLDSDERVRYLGEIALVPGSSPISQKHRLFYSTLLDENAASHIALGNSYRFAVKDGTTMTDEAYAAAGGNTSIVHVDFMIGSDQMDVDGILADGTTEPVMRDGEWTVSI